MTPNTLHEARLLWQMCFPQDEASFLDFYFERVAQPQDTYIDYNAVGEPIAHIGILRYGHTAEPHLRLAYISGACTHPSYRGQGVMGKLMRRVVAEETVLGTDALILIPADEDLRRYYACHFGFVDTAHCFSLPWQDYLGVLNIEQPKTPSPCPTSAELLQQATLSPQHITYSLEGAEAIIEEYRLSGAYVLERWEGELCKALMLARPSEEEIYIDSFIGTYQDALAMQADLPWGIPLLRTYLFPSEAELKAIYPLTSVQSKPWGMALPLSEAAQVVGWQQLGISLVHN